MATSLTTDTFHEFACTPCSEDDVNKEAIVFCLNCEEYFCRSCLKGHNRVTGAREHQLVDKDEFKHSISTSKKGGKPELPTEKCQNHHGKHIDMYCKDHDEIGCNACMTLEHRQCKQLLYIPNIASSRLIQQSIQTVSKQLSDQQDEFNTLKQNRKDNKIRVAHEKDACFDSINERRKAIDEHLDREERTLKDSVTDKYEEINTKLDYDMKTCDESINLLDTMKGKLHTSRNYNAPQTFIDLKRAEHAMKETGVKLGECKGNRNDQYTIVYEEGPSVKEVLSRDTLFGNVNVGYKIPTVLNKEEDINIRFNSDKSGCKCYGLCQVPDGTIIITDWNNENLKSLKYDNTYKQYDSLSMSNSPLGVCTVNDNEVAVTVPVDKKVSIVSVRPKMAVKSSFSVDGYCYGIAYRDGLLYVLQNHDSKLAVYSLQGQCMKTFSTNQTGTELFESPCHLCINPTKQQIIVADSNKGIVIIDKSGNLVAEYTYTNKSWTHGVCIDDGGNVYIADSGSKQLLVLDMDGIVTPLQDNIIGKPTAVHFDEHKQRLLVTFLNKDDIQSFSLH